MRDIRECRADFPLTEDLVYMDSASVSLCPEQVIGAVAEYDRRYRANVGRGVHRLTRFASQRFEDARARVAGFIGGQAGVTVLTANTTASVNMVAGGMRWRPGDRAVTFSSEHHSNLLPWLRLRERGVEVEVVAPEPDGLLDPAVVEAAVDDRTRLVALTHASNALGSVQPVREIGTIVHEHGARLLVDGAQSVPHLPVDVERLGCDYLCFSGHKMLGPTGTGILWMREPDLDPLLLGGGMIETVTPDGYTPAAPPARYEAGTPHVAGMIGLGRAVGYLEEVGMNEVRRHEAHLTGRLFKGLSGLDHVTVFGPDDPKKRIGVVSFVVDGMHPHDVAHILDEAAGIMVRSGEHCCMPLMRHLGLAHGTVRASLYLYNTAEEVDLLLAAVEEITRTV
ncbi:cysteine desulfurase [Methanofollis formosanus]|uniref:cysteine desulfurase n=1 Tax=Methanofollis formosanus TaxID=299308 RepID=A0A8G1EHU6_9EURY|nr:cysteine desulfurase [Methanofollis formosanus]QYZ80342.1 cysteine desulfurase [Methanofollis formosanus]